MSSENRRITFLTGGRSSRKSWLRIRRWYVATTAVGFVSWIIGLISMLIGGGIVPRLDDLLDDSTAGDPPRRGDLYPAWLVLHRTTGWPRDWQVDLAGSFAAAWRGPGAMAAGVAWLADGSLVWTPKRSWAQLGARGFGLHLDRTQRIECTQVSHRAAGLVLWQSDGSEVWLWMRNRDCRRVFDMLKAYAARVEE
jgi:hypothetical protein